MNSTLIEPESNMQSLQKTQSDVLELARHLDRFGRSAEQFLIQQLQQLETAIEEFEREKAAWRRQVRRETELLNRQTESLRRSREQHESNRVRNPTAAEVQNKQRIEVAKAAANQSGEAPIRLLLQPGKASLMQVGLLMFEISKLNRELGGRGLNYEVTGVRMPKKRLLARSTGIEASGEILELCGSSRLPLRGRGAHVELDVDSSERVANWITFKTKLLLSTLPNSELATVFNKGTSAKRDAELHSVIGDAVRRADEATRQEQELASYSSGVSLSHSLIDAAQQQLERLEGCVERLSKDCGLQLHFELKPS